MIETTFSTFLILQAAMMASLDEGGTTQNSQSHATSATVSKRFMEGPLSKWTNMVNGWQYRWFVLDQSAGLLSYYVVRKCFIYGQASYRSVEMAGYSIMYMNHLRCCHSTLICLHSQIHSPLSFLPYLLQSKDKMKRGSRRGCFQLKRAIIGIDDEDDSTFTIRIDSRIYHFQGKNSPP